ncbi:MAG: cytochrome C, partial [Nannocystaceae bacterium]
MAGPKLKKQLLVVLLGLVGVATGGLMGCPGDEAGSANPNSPENHGALVAVSAAPELPVPPPHRWSGAGCTSDACHGGIEPIRQPDTGMMREIFARGAALGDPDGCVVCHGGTPTAATAAEAHAGSLTELAQAGGPEDFYPDPASPWVNAFTCGQCHRELVQAQWNSLMMTEAGKIQGTTWSFGSLEGYEHRWANYEAQNPKDPSERLGTDAYRVYMAEKSAAHPNVFVDQMHALPEAPSPGTLGDLEISPEDAVFTYLRAECQRCHLGVKGRQRRGDYRGMGCGACHMPYSNEGLYEGGDTTIPEAPGHALVHSLQGTRDAKVYVHENGYTGIPVETCTTCHNRGKRIGVSYQGLMESAWASPYTEGGGGQLGLHTKHYISMEQDVHYQRGMLCQDCHTSADVHGDKFLAGANLGPIEIECSDCHGTPTAYPWELPLGWGDENGPGQATGDPRGVGEPSALPAYLRRGDPAPPRDGYLLTARGNPMPDAVRDGNRIVIHTVGGKDLTLEPLRKKTDEGRLSPEATAAMVHASKHIETMECYTCHTSWAPQCYGCHVKVDYSEGNKAFDWVKAGQLHKLDPEHRRDRSEAGYGTLIPGKITEMRSYLRWEDPALGVNGEGRVSPIVPGCQVSATIIGPDGEEILRNNLFRTTP